MVFVRSLGDVRDISKRSISAGALGCGIKYENAITIGLLPDHAEGQVIYHWAKLVFGVLKWYA